MYLGERRPGWRAAAAAAVPFILLYVVAPPILLMAPTIHRHALFLNLLKLPFTKYDDLTANGVESVGRNFYITTEDDIRVGVWHILPKSISDAQKMKESEGQLGSDDFESLLAITEHPIIVYYHGNAFDRSNHHRVELYNVFSKKDAHVIALDYRGYGDSGGSPSESGIVHDSISIYKWVKERSGDNPVYVWGHSLGTGVGVKAVGTLCEQSLAPDGLFLEAPFNNLRDIIYKHPITLPFRWLPFFDRVFVRPITDEADLNSDKRIQKVSCPIVILHAKDDHIVPFELGKNLYDIAKEQGKNVEFIEFEAARQFEHKYICRALELPVIIQ